MMYIADLMKVYVKSVFCQDVDNGKEVCGNMFLSEQRDGR